MNILLLLCAMSLSTSSLVKTRSSKNSTAVDSFKFKNKNSSVLKIPSEAVNQRKSEQDIGSELPELRAPETCGGKECETKSSENVKSICVLGKCAVCTKYNKPCLRDGITDPTKTKSLCCPTKGKKPLNCVSAIVLKRKGVTGVCLEDRCLDGHSLVPVKIPGYADAVLRCDGSFGEGYGKYDFQCIAKSCTICGADDVPCGKARNPVTCCPYAKCNEENKCQRECGDLAYKCQKIKCCPGLRCIFKNNGIYPNTYECRADEISL